MSDELIKKFEVIRNKPKHLGQFGKPCICDECLQWAYENEHQFTQAGAEAMQELSAQALDYTATMSAICVNKIVDKRVSKQWRERSAWASSHAAAIRVIKLPEYKNNAKA